MILILPPVWIRAYLHLPAGLVLYVSSKGTLQEIGTPVSLIISMISNPAAGVRFVGFATHNWSSSSSLQVLVEQGRRMSLYMSLGRMVEFFQGRCLHFFGVIFNVKPKLELVGFSSPMVLDYRLELGKISPKNDRNQSSSIVRHI